MKQILPFWATSLFVLISVFANAQIEESVPLTEMHRQSTMQQKVMAVGDTIEMPFNDDFSYKSTRPNSTFWADNKVYVNSHLATNMFSIGVASFDGTDEYGFPYDITNNGSDTFADVLTSRYIKFPVQPSNVFLSFYYQAAGLGDVPEPEDSLVVEFWSPVDSAWEQQWAVVGQLKSTPFRAAILPVNDPKYLVDGFRFRFGAYGAKNGTFDIWNIDYVELDANRTPNDTIIREPAFVRAHPQLSEPFTRIPWFHYNDAQLNDSLTFTYRRNGPPPSGGWALNLGKYDVWQDGANIKSRQTVPVVTNLNHNIDIDFKVPLKPISTTNTGTEFELKMRTYFDGTAEGLRNNDTVEVTVPFRNYYGMDDNTSEHGYGIKNQTNARMAFQFVPIQPDTLHGLLINFAHVGVDATENTFRIGIWNDLNGQPGLLLYQSDSLYTPEYPYYFNGFMPFELDEPQFVAGNVFIGLIQTKSDPIHVGLDKTTTGVMNKFYGSGFNWNESLVSGTWMIRPYFQYTPTDFGWEENQASSIEVFPNPAQNTVYLKTDEPVKWMLMNATGQVVKNGKTKHIDVSALSRGLYILQIEQNQNFISQKIILQ